MNTITVSLAKSKPELKDCKSITFVDGNTFDALCRLLELVNSGFIVAKIEEEQKRVCVFNYTLLKPQEPGQ